MFGVNGNTLGDIEADIAAQEAYGGCWADEGDPGMGGPVGPSSEGSTDARDESNPTNSAGGRQAANFNTATLSGAMRSASSWAGSLLSGVVPGLGALQTVARGLGSFIGNPNRGNFANRAAFESALVDQYTDPDTYDFSLIDTFAGPERGRRGMISAPMSGHGARMGIAVGVDPITGLNVGPGYPGEPGDVNPYNDVPFSDPADPYIRKPRGTEIVAMVGP